MKEFRTNVTVANIYFWDYNVVRIVSEKNIVDFDAIPEILTLSVNEGGFNGFLNFSII